MVARNSRRPISPQPSETQAAVDTALRYLAVRPRSEREVRRRLQRSSYAPDLIDAVLERLRSHGYVDDVAFARYWVAQRQTFRPRGARLLRAELWQHGVAAPLPELDPEADAMRAAAKHARQLQHLQESEFRARLGQRLARRGFDWDVIERTVAQLWDEVSTSSGSAPAPTA